MEPQKPDENKKKALTFQNANRIFLKGRQKRLTGFKNKIFIIRKQTQGKGHLRMLVLRSLDLAKRLKILAPKQMLQRLPITRLQKRR